MLNGAAKRAEDNGAAAVVLVLGIPGNHATQMNTPGAGGPVSVPVFSMGLGDGTLVRELIEQGEDVKVQMRADIETRTGLKSAAVWGTLPGTTDEDIMLMTHHDSYFEGAGDNACGMATILGIAEYFAKVPEAQRRRELRVVITPGHHEGAPAARWMHENRDTVFAKTALTMNPEHDSVVQTYRFANRIFKSNTIDAVRYFVYGSDRLFQIMLDAHKLFGVAIYHEMWQPSCCGESGYISTDAPNISHIESPALVYHIDTDTPDIVSPWGMEAMARSFAKIIDDVNQLDRKELFGKPVPATENFYEFIFSRT
jgi:hypothetical protein